MPAGAKTAWSDDARAAVSLLVIDDTPGMVELVSSAMAQPGLEIITATDPEEGLALFRKRRPHIVLTDLVMPRMTGMEVLERIMDVDPATDVILMSAQYSTDSAVEAIKKGASDYLNKPVPLGPLRERIERLVLEVRKRQLALQLEDELRTASEFEGIVGRSPQMWEMFWRIRRVAPHYRSLLITGETGTGKDLAARALHRLSPVALGHFDFDHRETIVQVLPKSLLGDGSPQVVIRGGNDAHIHFAGGQRSHSLHFLTLEHAQQLGLSGERHVSDLVQEQRASVSILEQARLVVRGAGERTLHVPKQLALEQRFHNRRAVEHDVPAGRNRAEPMERARNQVFTGPGLPRDQQ